MALSRALASAALSALWLLKKSSPIRPSSYRLNVAV